jgi:putative lipoprotein
VGGELRFATTRSYAVLTGGAPNNVDLVLDAVQPAPVSTTTPAVSGNANVMAELKDTYWKLIELDGAKVVMAPAQRREVRITLASAGSRLIGFSGCNQFVGAYVQDGTALRFTQMAGTQMACASPFMELESQVLKMLGATTGYRIEGEQLTLLAGDQVLARFEAVYLR